MRTVKTIRYILLASNKSKQLHQNFNEYIFETFIGKGIKFYVEKFDFLFF